MSISRFLPRPGLVALLLIAVGCAGESESPTNPNPTPSTTPEYVLKWGTPGAGIGQFAAPSGVAVDASGNIYVADNGNHRIQKFNAAFLGERIGARVLVGGALVVAGLVFVHRPHRVVRGQPA